MTKLTEEQEEQLFKELNIIHEDIVDDMNTDHLGLYGFCMLHKYNTDSSYKAYIDSIDDKFKPLLHYVGIYV